MNDEFYIGYESAMPDGMAVRVRAAAAILLSLAVVVPALLVLAQGRFARSTFEFGRTRTFEGMVIEHPYPALLVSSRGEMGLRSHAQDATVYWLVGAGKHGASDIVNGRDGRIVRLSGTLIERDEDKMVEVSSREAVTEIGSREPAAFEPMHAVGAIAVRGEIVDSKCHLGVMKPGEGPTHRDCAVRCLLGRITPMFAPRRDEAHMGRLALLGIDGRPFDEALDTLVGRPVEIRGELIVRGPLRFLATSAAAVRAQ
jgi:hypothetical protein